MSTKYSDRFSEASNDLQDKSGFVCESCNKIFDKDEAVKREMTCCNRTMRELVQESFGP